jgi:hypothetical protein
MNRKELQFLASDSWLLLAIILAAGNDKANLVEIIAAGDGINMAIFTEDEMESGLYRLTVGGYVEEVGGEFRPTKITSEKYKELTKQKKSLINHMELLREFIGAQPWEVGGSVLRPEDKFKYPGFTKESFF